MKAEILIQELSKPRESAVKQDSMVQDIITISQTAGKAILEVYDSDFSVEQKDDKSPLTLADKRSHEIIAGFLHARYPYPVLSEEGKNIPFEERKDWECFWLVDPLDGTKEFIKRNGEFTVNIALIKRDRPVLGVIYQPVADLLYYAVQGEGSFKIEGGRGEKLPLSRKKDNLTVAGSRSHGSKAFDDYVEVLRTKYGTCAFISAGSSLKFCLVAEGRADIYPRLAPTMEWDTAAGQMIVEEAGGLVLESKSRTPLRYNKESLLNPHFVAFGKDTHV